jgi:hypothetical protein
MKEGKESRFFLLGAAAPLREDSSLALRHGRKFTLANRVAHFQRPSGEIYFLENLRRILGGAAIFGRRRGGFGRR